MEALTSRCVVGVKQYFRATIRGKFKRVPSKASCSKSEVGFALIDECSSEVRQNCWTSGSSVVACQADSNEGMA